MPDDPLDDLVSEYERRRAAGETVTPAELCPNDPARQAFLERRLAELSAANAVFDDFASAPAAPPDGSVNRFTVTTTCTAERVVGRGGMGEVFLARDDTLGRPVAVKRPGRPGGDRFQREAAITSRLDHPSVVPVYGLGTDAAGRPCYAMRFVDGQTLRDAINAHHAGTGPGLRAMLGRFVAVCNAVAYAHNRGVVHRDLKPANILIGPFGETLVVDWGLAKEIGTADEPTGGAVFATGPDPFTEVGLVLGTPAYAAPEQIDGGEVGPTTDVFALGGVLFTILTGRPPIANVGSAERFDRLRTGRYDSLGSAPRPLAAVTLKALRTAPADRYPSALAMAADIEAFLADEPVSVYRGSVGERFARWSRRHRPLMRGLVAVLAAITVAATIGVVLVSRERDRTDLARQDAERSRDEAADALADLTDEVVERQLAQRSQLGPAERQFLQRVADRTERLLPSAPDASRRAAGLLRLAVLRSRLDDGSAVTDLFARAVAAAREAGNPGALASALVKQAGHLSATGKTAEAAAALAEAEALLAADPNRRFDLAAARVQTVNLTMWQKPEEADRVFTTEAEAVRRLPDTPAHRELLARMLTNSGNLAASRGKLDEAGGRFTEAVGLYRRLKDDDPRQPAHRAALAAALVSSGMVADDQQKPTVAIAAYEEAATEFRRLATESPSVFRHRAGLGYALMTVAQLHQRAGRTAEAAGRYDEALAEYRRLVADQPNVPTHHWQLSETALAAAGVKPATAAILLTEAARHADRAAELAPAEPAYRRQQEKVRAASAKR